MPCDGPIYTRPARALFSISSRNRATVCLAGIFSVSGQKRNQSCQSQAMVPEGFFRFHAAVNRPNMLLSYPRMAVEQITSSLVWKVATVFIATVVAKSFSNIHVEG